MKWLLLILGSLAAVLALMALVGAFLPRAHRASRAAAFRQTPAALYAVVRDFAPATPWQSDLLRAELLPPQGGRVRFREFGKFHEIDYVVLADRPGEQLVLKIAGDKLPFGGTWTYDFAPASEGATVRITEDGEIKSALFRFQARFIFGYNRSMDGRLRDLGRKFGETVVPRD